METGTNNNALQQSGSSGRVSVKVEATDANTVDVAGASSSNGCVVINDPIEQLHRQREIEERAAVSMDAPAGGSTNNRNNETGDQDVAAEEIAQTPAGSVAASLVPTQSTGSIPIIRNNVKREIADDTNNNDDDDIIPLDVIEEHALVKNECTGEQIEVRIKPKDKTLSLNTLKSLFPGAHGLKYQTESGGFRGLLVRIEPDDTKFLPPTNGWKGKTCIVIFDQLHHPQQHQQSKQQASSSESGIRAPPARAFVPEVPMAAAHSSASVQPILGEHLGALVTRSSKRLAETTASGTKQQNKKLALEISESYSGDNSDQEGALKIGKPFRAGFRCSECPYHTDSKRWFENHFAGHIRKNGFKCEHCNYWAINKSAIRHHQKIHRHTN